MVGLPFVLRSLVLGCLGLLFLLFFLLFLLYFIFDKTFLKLVVEFAALIELHFAEEIY